MALTNNAFCWTGIVSSDPDSTGRFYEKTLGWKIQSHTFENGDTSTMCMVNGVPRLHIRAPQMDGERSHWLAYMRVDNVDASAKAAGTNGGAVVVPPTDIAPGRFAVVRSPSGAHMALFHEASEADSSDAPAETGGVHWTELHSQDVDNDLAWLSSTFGYQTDTMPIPNGTYYLLKDGDAQRGGVMAAMMEQAPSMWLTWIQVDDVDGVVTKIGKEGGTVLSQPADMPGIGRMAVASDPTGGVFGVITPA